MTASKSAPQQAADARVEAAARALAEVDDKLWERLNAELRDQWRQWAKAALTAADRAGWRDIASAPKDGKPIHRLQAECDSWRRVAERLQTELGELGAENETLEAEIVAGRRAFAVMQERIAELEAEVRDFNDMLRQAEEVSARGGP